jgi:PPOX class probable F420-dependent enzyme
MKNREFLKTQKILRLATIDLSGSPHIVPVWYSYLNGRFYVGTNTKTQKAKNIRNNPKVSLCVDTGVKSPNIFGVLVTGRARLILQMNQVQLLAKKILLRYFKNLKSKSAQQLLNDTDCVIEITPKQIVSWKY